MKKKISFFLISLSALLLCACSNKSQIKFTDFTPNTTRAEAEKALGEPIETETFKTGYRCKYDMSIDGINGIIEIKYISKSEDATIVPYTEKSSGTSIGVEWHSDKNDKYNNFDDLKPLEEQLRHYLEKEMGARYQDFYDVTSCHHATYGFCVHITSLID